MNDILFKSKISRETLFYLNKNKVSYASKIALEVCKCTLHTTRILHILENLNLVERQREERNGRLVKYKSKKTNYYKLTEKGQRVTNLLLKIERKLNGRLKNEM